MDADDRQYCAPPPKDHIDPMSLVSDSMNVFDRRAVRRHRDRAAATIGEFDFLTGHVADQILDRLDDVRRDFRDVLEIGGRDGALSRRLVGRKGIGRAVSCDLSPSMARLAENGVAADEEALPFAAGAFDLVVSNLSLHWTNDLPGALIQAGRVLKPDGLLLATLLGGDTLHELRRAMMEAEMEVAGGVSPRISPFTEVRDAGGLLQRAGFALPVVDSDTLTVTYENAFRLIADLRGMGETQANLNRDPRPPKRGFWPAVARHYHEMFARPDGRIPATFQIITLTGWAPHESQQKPLRPGSAESRLADALGAEERPLPDRPA